MARDTDRAHDHQHRPDPLTDPACAIAHGDLPTGSEGRRLVLVFDSPVARELAHFAPHLGWSVVILEPTSTGDEGSASAGEGLVPAVADAAAARLDEHCDVVVTDHDRPELGDILAQVLALPTRWVGVMGSLRHTAPHVAALSERGVQTAEIARVHRPIGLDIGSRSPAEIAIATLAGLLADRNGRSGGKFASRTG